MNTKLSIVVAGGIVTIAVMLPLGYHLYVEHEKEMAMRCVYNSALLRGGTGAAAQEKAAREAAEKMIESGVTSAVAAYRYAAVVYGCESP